MTTEYTVLFPFSGLGAGALGFVEASAQLLGKEARFRSLGGIDVDDEACRDFVYLTQSPSLCADISKLTREQLIDFAGASAPDVVFLSAPCQGSSKLLSAARALEPKYQALNDLALHWIRLQIETWGDGVKLVLFENVPNITTRAKAMLREVKRMLRAAGYILHDGYHNAGELGGLAQNRKRWLMVARHPKRVPPLLYQPVKRRVRACGEVLGELPMPEDPAAGPMHKMPRISWLNWVRLALIPAGGDWRDLPNVLEEGQTRREKFKRHAVERWDAATGTIGGSGSNGVANVADPRVDAAEARRLWEQKGIKTDGERHWFKGKYGVGSWDEPSRAVIGGPSNGANFVADPRLIPQAGNPNMHDGKYVVRGWEQPSKTVTGAGRVGSGAQSVADPRLPPPLVPPKAPYDKAYGVLAWDDAAHTIAAGSDVGQGAYAVADARVTCTPRAGAYGVLDWTEAAKTITGAACLDNGTFSVADPRTPETPVALVDRAERSPFVFVEETDARGKAKRKKRSVHVVIRAADGTWHRPMTTLELAALQGLPTMVRGAPLTLAGTRDGEHRTRVGNAVPPPAARAIAERMLVNLLGADAASFSLSSGGAVWVRSVRRAAILSQRESDDRFTDEAMQ